MRRKDDALDRWSRGIEVSTAPKVFPLVPCKQRPVKILPSSSIPCMARSDERGRDQDS